MHCGDSADPIVVARQIIQIGIISVSMISNVKDTNEKRKRCQYKKIKVIVKSVISKH